MKLPSQLLPDHPAYDVLKHLAYVQELHAAYPFRDEDDCVAKVEELTKDAPPLIKAAAQDFTADILEEDIFILEKPMLQYAPYLMRMQKRLTLKPDPAFQALKTFLSTLYPHIPKEKGPFKIPLGELLSPDELIGFCWTLYSLKHDNEVVFPNLRQKLFENLVRASGHQPDTYDGKKRLITPEDSNFSPQEKLQRYLADTPFLELFETRVPFSIPRKAFTEHGAIFAKTGHGKTQTLRTLILSFLSEPDPPALFVIDGNGSLIENIDRLDIFHPTCGRLRDRLVILDPTDTPPALNFFKMPASSPAKQMELFFYLFKAIDQSLTQRQATMVAYLSELMTAVDGDLDTLRDLCETKVFPFEQHLEKLPQITQDFFTRQFYGKDALVNQTKQQIAQRLYTIGRFPRFSQMFNATENKFDALTCMQQKKICLINTDRSGLGDAGSALFGRFILAQCLAAAFQRPKHQRHLALIVCDEAKAYLDDQAQMILSDSRAFGMGLLLATQFPHQLEEGVRREIITNTTIKMMGPVEYAVASQYARDMFTTPDFIMGMRSYDRSHADWACHVANITAGGALKLSVPFGLVEKEPVMDGSAHQTLLEKNRKRYGAAAYRTPHKATPSAFEKKQDEPRGSNTSPLEYDTDI